MVTGRDPGAAQANLAGRLAVVRQILVVGIEDADVHAGQDQALLALEIPPLVLSQALPQRGLEAVDGHQRRGFGGAVAVHHLGTREFVEADHHRQRRLARAGQHAHAAEVRLDRQRLDVLQHRLEDGRCAVGDGHALGNHGVDQRLGVLGSVASRQHDLVGQQRGGLW